MLGHHRHGLQVTFGESRGAMRNRNRRGRRPWRLEGVENRLLLAGGPTIYTVNANTDIGAGSGTVGDLLFCITQANSNPNTAGSEIEFDPSFVNGGPGIITLSSTLVLSETAGPEVIDGPGGITVSGNEAVGVFTVESGVTAALSGLIISGGWAGSGGAGGIYNEGTLTVANSLIVANFAANGVAAITNTGAMTIINSSIGGNNSSGDIGGILSDGTMTITNSAIVDNSYGGIVNGGTMTVTNSTIADNSGFIFGGGIENDGTMTVTNSTIADNSAGLGGGIENDGTLTVTNSTVADNSARGEGGGIFDDGTLTVTNSTIADNSVVSGGGTGGGLEVIAGAASLNNTIVALNTVGTGSGATASDIAGTVAAASAYNLIGTGGSGGLINVNGNQVGVANPGLDPNGLQNNGGPTQTIALLTTSPAIDAGSNALAVDPATGQPLLYDQRGPGFPRIVNGTVDIGAYEFQGAVVTGYTVGWGIETISLQTAAGHLRLLPAGRNTDLPWLGIDELSITLSTAETLASGDVTVTSAIGVNYGPVTITGSGTSYTITLAQPITESDRVTITIGNADIVTVTRRLDVLPGDIGDYGVVNAADLLEVRDEWLRLDGAVPTIFGDINGDGVVNEIDYDDVLERLHTRLPSVSDASIAPNTVGQAGPELVRIGPSKPLEPAAAHGARPRAEIRLSGRGWSLGTLTRGRMINQRLIHEW